MQFGVFGSYRKKKSTCCAYGKRFLVARRGSPKDHQNTDCTKPVQVFFSFFFVSVWSKTTPPTNVDWWWLLWFTWRRSLTFAGKATESPKLHSEVGYLACLCCNLDVLELRHPLWGALIWMMGDKQRCWLKSWGKRSWISDHRRRAALWCPKQPFLFNQRKEKHIHPISQIKGNTIIHLWYVGNVYNTKIQPFVEV